MKNTDIIDIRVTRYVKSVLTGLIVAGQAIRLACQRFQNWYTTGKYYFDANKVNRIIDFIEHLKHFEDEYAGKPFILEDWQCWIIANIFGWYQNNDHSKRVIRNVFLLISRKNGKSALSAAMMLASMVVDGVAGAECYLVANNRELAKICYKFISGFSTGLDPKQRHLKTYRDYLLYPKTKSKLKVLSSDAMGNDGYNPSCFILDEFHAAANYDSYNVLKSGQAARKNPLAIIISSAGYLLDTYPCYETAKVGMEVLQGIKEDDSWFYAMYQLDENDEWRDSKVWPKACPNYGITVYEDYMVERIKEATNDTAKEADVKTKNLNMWVQSLNGWLPTDLVANNMHVVDADKFGPDEPCYIGVDLSEVSDLTSVSLLWPPNEARDYYPDKFVFKTMVYIPQAALKSSVNHSKYESFVHSRYAKVTDGPTVNYDAILADIISCQNHGDIIKISYDAWMALLFTKKATEEGFNMEAYSQTIGNFTRPTLSFEVLLKNDRIIIDKNTCVLWSFGNVELRQDSQNNVKPQKAGGDKLKKIDPVISMLEALGGWLLEQSIYYGD